MSVETHRIEAKTQGNCHILDLTPEIRRCLAAGSVRNGLVNVFVIGSTASVSTTEFEPGLVRQDLAAAYQRLAPEDIVYRHEDTWHDDNGHSHVRATIQGCSVTVPLIDGEMPLGTYQQIILVDFDTRARKRQVIVQVVGE